MGMVEIPKLERPPIWMEVLMKFLAKLIRPPAYMFPITPVWKWYPILLTNIKIPPGEKYVVYDAIASGWIYFVMCEVDDPDVRFCADIYGEGSAELRYTAREIYDLGLVSPNIKLIWVSVYDEAAKKYVLIYTPPGLGTPFRGRNKAWFENPTGQEVTIKKFSAYLILIK